MKAKMATVSGGCLCPPDPLLLEILYSVHNYLQMTSLILLEESFSSDEEKF